MYSNDNITTTINEQTIHKMKQLLFENEKTIFFLKFFLTGNHIFSRYSRIRVIARQRKTFFTGFTFVSVQAFVGIARPGVAVVGTGLFATQVIVTYEYSKNV